MRRQPGGRAGRRGVCRVARTGTVWFFLKVGFSCVRFAWADVKALAL